MLPGYTYPEAEAVSGADAGVRESGAHLVWAVG